MKNRNSFRLIVLVVFVCFSCEEDEYIREAVSKGILEGPERSFNTVEGSDRFIDKYDLNDDEIKMIGRWGFDGIICKIPPEERRYGPGLTIKFYPNRIFQIHRDNVNNKNQTRAIFGEWQVIDKKLQVRFRAKLLLSEPHGENEYNNYTAEYMGRNAKSYTIFEVPQYKVAYFNTDPFDWSGMPYDLIVYLGFKGNDSPRSRLLFDSLGAVPGNITDTGKIGILLFNPDIESKNYLIDLLNVW